MIGDGGPPRDVATGERVSIRIAGGRIAGVDRSPAGPSTGEPGTWVAPAFWDTQINGRWGIAFSDPTLTVDEVIAIVRAQAELGTARVCPTLITGPFEALRHGVATIAAACERDREVGRMVLGIHLEGPSISEVDGYRGAHPREHVRGPDWDEFERLQEDSGQRIVLVTLAPERPGAIDFIGEAARSGVTVALGHTSADPATIDAAVAAGATLSTHLGNGVASPLPRHPNPIWSQAGDDRLYASLIADGHHLDPAVLRVLIRAKGPERSVLVSDASRSPGCRSAVWRLGRRPVGQGRGGRDAVSRRVESRPHLRDKLRAGRGPRVGAEGRPGDGLAQPGDPARLPVAPDRRGVPANLIEFRLDGRELTLLGTIVDGRWTPRGEGRRSAHEVAPPGRDRAGRGFSSGGGSQAFFAGSTPLTQSPSSFW